MTAAARWAGIALAAAALVVLAAVSWRTIRWAAVIIAIAGVVAGFGAEWIAGGGTGPDAPAPAASCYTRPGPCPPSLVP